MRGACRNTRRQHAEGLEVVVVEDVDIVAGFGLEVGVAEGDRVFVGAVSAGAPAHVFRQLTLFGAGDAARVDQAHIAVGPGVEAQRCAGQQVVIGAGELVRRSVAVGIERQVVHVVAW